MKEYFEALTDSKSTAQFAEIVMMVVCAVIAGCDVWEDIADYCRKGAMASRKNRVKAGEWHTVT